MGAVGTRLSFRYFGIVGGIAGIIYLALNLLWLQKLIKKRHSAGICFKNKVNNDSRGILLIVRVDAHLYIYIYIYVCDIKQMLRFLNHKK